MYVAAAACLRRKSSVSPSFTRSSVPAPPGTQITSSCGQSAKLVVGVSSSTVSLGTGSMRFQIRWIFAPGTLENTCNGPVKSSWVTFGNSRMPICSGSDIATSKALDAMIVACSVDVSNAVFPSFEDIGLPDDRRFDISGFPAARRRGADLGVRDRTKLCRQAALDQNHCRDAWRDAQFIRRRDARARL